MKKLFVLFSSLLLLFNSYGYNPPSIDEQLLRSFAVQFPNAQKVAWQESDDAYVVSFIENGIRLRIVYLRNGALTHFIRYYFEENLPLDLRLQVKNKFPGKRIFGVTEENIISNIENHSKTIYYIKLVDESNWYTIRAGRNKKLKIIEKLNKGI